MKRCLVSWSGGKDSCYAAMQAKAQGYDPVVLLNVLNEEGKISRSHGIPQQILQAQANAAGLPLYTIASSWQDYEQHFTAALNKLKEDYQLTHAIFGDIDLQAHRDWEEKVCVKTGFEAVLPLWKRNRKDLVLEMLNEGIETMIVSCNEIMGEQFLGLPLTTSLIYELEELGIDPCGENGEYHTLVTNTSLFNQRLEVKLLKNQQHNSYWFAALSL